jgi:hypothetical protein
LVHILEIGKIIYHDFSKNIPELKTNDVSEVKQETTYDKMDNQFWKDKYFTLLEEHNVLLKEYLALKTK